MVLVTVGRFTSPDGSLVTWSYTGHAKSMTDFNPYHIMTAAASAYGRSGM